MNSDRMEEEDQMVAKYRFFERYEPLPRQIKKNSSCYAVASEWFHLNIIIYFKVEQFRCPDLLCQSRGG